MRRNTKIKRKRLVAKRITRRYTLDVFYTADNRKRVRSIAIAPQHVAFVELGTARFRIHNAGYMTTLNVRVRHVRSSPP